LTVAPRKRDIKSENKEEDIEIEEKVDHQGKFAMPL
jgi:hypothetical protein